MELKERFEYIKRNIRYLDDLLQRYTANDIIENYTLLTSVLYVLQTSIQSMIDIGLRFLAELGKKPPNRYSDVGDSLKEEGIFDQNDAILFEKIVGFRNVVVHQYMGIDLNILKKILEERLYRDIYKLALKILKTAEVQGIDP